MTTLHEIEAAVSRLSSQELAEFRAWFEARDARAWDGEIEQDIRTGRLDELAEKALADRAAGRTKEL
jgi:hypothetical protein